MIVCAKKPNCFVKPWGHLSVALKQIHGIIIVVFSTIKIVKCGIDMGSQPFMGLITPIKATKIVLGFCSLSYDHYL